MFKSARKGAHNRESENRAIDRIVIYMYNCRHKLRFLPEGISSLKNEEEEDEDEEENNEKRMKELEGIISGMSPIRKR